MNKWKIAVKSRFQITIILFTIGLLICILHTFLKNDIIKDVLSCIGTSLISASITIFLVKYDIMDSIKSNNISNYGIIDIKDGRNGVFNSENVAGLKDKDWNGFLKSSSDKTIVIVGISMYSFFYPNKLIDYVIQLGKKGYTIKIIFANPESMEVELQSIEEGKEGKLKENIKFLSNEFKRRIDENNDIDVKNNLKIFYSKTLPRSFIVKSGDKMIITPYLLKGPFEEPTIIASQLCVKENSYYNAYNTYIQDLLKSAEEFEI